MEIAVDIDGDGLLGIELERCSPDRRAAVKLVMPGSLALRTGRVRRGMVLTSVNGQPTAALCHPARHLRLDMSITIIMRERRGFPVGDGCRRWIGAELGVRTEDACAA